MNTRISRAVQEPRKPWETVVVEMTPPAAGFSYFAVFHNYPLAAAVLGFAVAQSIKFFVTWYKENRWDPKQLIGSGGMPSSHSATVTALAVAIGFQDGFGSALFATAAIFASVVGYHIVQPGGPESPQVMYDASGIRLHAGKQAEVLNQIVCELPSEHPLSETRLHCTNGEFYPYLAGQPCLAWGDCSTSDAKILALVTTCRLGD